MESLFRTTDAVQIRDHLEKHLAHNNGWDQKKTKKSTGYSLQRQ